jgi:hypothetical protein
MLGPKKLKIRKNVKFVKAGKKNNLKHTINIQNREFHKYGSPEIPEVGSVA